MNSLLLSALLVTSVSIGARAEQSDAYVSLVGMADSASTDKGPEPGEIASNTIEEQRSSDDASSSVEPKTEIGSSPVEALTVTTPEPKPVIARAPSRKEDDTPVVIVSQARSPRIWTKLFASLLPPMTRIELFEVKASSVVLLARPAPTRPATPASVTGSARGLLEVVAAATAPLGR